MIRRAAGLTTFGLALLLILLAVVFSQSYRGRQAVIADLQKNCERTAQNSAALINESRANIVGNSIVADDPHQPWRTRHARAQQVLAERTAIAVLLSHMDGGHAFLLQDATDRLVAVRDGFRCSAAFPDANPITG